MSPMEEIWNENIQSTVSRLDFILCSPILWVFADPLVKEDAFSETNGENVIGTVH